MINTEALYAPFDNVPTRPGRGGEYAYIKWQNVADRMNKIFGQNWSSEVVYQDIIGQNIIIRVKISIYDEDTGLMFYQEGFGGAPNDTRIEAGNAFKSAYSKALKDACKKWGIALFLEEDTEENYPSIPTGYKGKEVASGAELAPPTMEWAPEVTKGMPTPPKPLGQSVPSNKPVSKGMSMPASAGMPTPPSVSFSKTGGAEATQTGPSKTNAPPMPKAPQTSAPHVTPPAPPIASKTEAIDNGGPEYISNVQKAALHSILSIQGVKYDDLVKDAFKENGITKTSIPEPDMLTYDEAVCIVKYGNDKFRRR